MIIRQATKEDLKQIAIVHAQCFPHSFSTVLGKFRKYKLLGNFYKEYMDKVPELFLVALDEEEKICGFAMGYYCEQNDYQKMFLKHNFFSIGFRTLCLLLCFNKITWKKVFSKKEKEVTIIDQEYSKVPNKMKGDLLSICVLQECRGKKIGSSLLSEYEKIQLKNGKEYNQLTVEASNKAGIALYEKLNYQKFKTNNAGSVGYYKKLK